MKMMEQSTSNALHGNAEKTDKLNFSDKTEQLVERREIKDSPFVAIKTGTEEWFLTWGKYKISEETDLKTLQERVKKREWITIMNIVSVMITELINEKNG